MAKNPSTQETSRSDCEQCELGCSLSGLAGLAAREVGLEYVPVLVPSPSPDVESVIIAH